MFDRIIHTWEMVDARAIVQIAILAVSIFFLLQFLGKSRGMGVVRAFGLVIVVLFLAAQILVSLFDLTVLGRILDYLLATMLLALLVIFQPELRRGLMWLGRYGLFHGWGASRSQEIAEAISDAAINLSSKYTGALIAIEREVPLQVFSETGTKIDAEISAGLIQSIFQKQSPLHDGAVIIRSGRIVAAGCQLPLASAESSSKFSGMRHRAALGTSEETDALLLVVSEETGLISLLLGGSIEVTSREDLQPRLTEIMEQPSSESLESTRPHQDETSKVA